MDLGRRPEARFPDALTVSQDGFNGTIELQTNLPDGTRYSSQGGEGSCCEAVKDGTLRVEIANGHRFVAGPALSVTQLAHRCP